MRTFFSVMTESSTEGTWDNLNVYIKPKSLLDVPGSVKLGGFGEASEMEEMNYWSLLGVYCSQLLSEQRGNFGVCFMAEIICQFKFCHYGRFVMIVRLAAPG